MEGADSQIEWLRRTHSAELQSILNNNSTRYHESPMRNIITRPQKMRFGQEFWMNANGTSSFLGWRAILMRPDRFKGIAGYIMPNIQDSTHNSHSQKAFESSSM
jgi:hypothetical protein